MSATAAKKVESARVVLVLDQPFFGYLLLSLKVIEDRTCKTAWVDGRSLGYNPTFIDGLTHDEIVGVLTHEVMHCALGHPWRRDGRTMLDWNIACDKPINTELRDAGFHLPANVYYAEGDEVGKSAEWIYGRLQAQPPQPPDNPQPDEDEPEEDEDGESTDGQPGKPDEDEDGDEDGDSGEGKDGQPGEDGESGDGDESGEQDGDKAGGNGKPDPQGELRDAPTGDDEDGDPAPTEQEWKEKTMSAALQAQAQGKLPGGLKRLVEQAQKPKIDVRSLLLRFFSERSNSDYSWTMPNQRYIAQGLYLPALKSEALGHVAIANDTSGSRGNVAMDQARKIVESVIEECNPVAVTVYHVDADVHQTARMEQGEPLDWNTDGGGGGTDFRPAFEAAATEPDIVCLVYITDMFGTFPEVPPPFPVIWLSTTEHFEAPFGETVYVEGV